MNKNMNIDNDDRMLKELGLTKESPMKVPEGYFDNLSSRIMDRIAEEEEQGEKTATVVSMNRGGTSIWKYAVRWTVAAAACVALVFLGVNYYEDKTDALAQSDTMTEEYDDEYGEDMMSYSMMDEQDVYCYLAGIE